MNRDVAASLGIGDSGFEIGLVAPDRADEVRALEAAGARSFWVGGHVASTNPTPEAMMWLARLAEQTTTATVGAATLLLPLYPPAIVAKQIADLDRASGGRVALGVGIGGEYSSDFVAAEVPIRERAGRTDEAIGLLRRFWTAEPVTHTGIHHRFESLRIHPAPAQTGGPPIIVTGRQPAAMRRAAVLGDGWMPYLYSSDRYRSSMVQVRDAADAIGRDLAGFVTSCYVFVSVDDRLDRATDTAVEFLGATYRQDARAYVHRVMCIGTMESVADQLAEYVDAGASHLVLAPVGPNRAELARALITEIRPRLRGVGG